MCTIDSGLIQFWKPLYNYVPWGAVRLAAKPRVSSSLKTDCCALCDIMCSEVSPVENMEPQNSLPGVFHGVKGMPCWCCFLIESSASLRTLQGQPVSLERSGGKCLPFNSLISLGRVNVRAPGGAGALSGVCGRCNGHECDQTRVCLDAENKEATRPTRTEKDF